LSHAAKKYAVKYDPALIAQKYASVQEIAIEEETIALIGNKALEKRVKNALLKDSISSLELLPYFYCAENGAALVKKYRGGTLIQEASLLRFKWLIRGLELDLLDKVLFVAGIDVTRLLLWNVGAARLPQPLGNGVFTADSSEYLVVELTGLNRLMGYINLKNMQAGDTIIIREYVKLLSSSSYSEYDKTLYVGVQVEPVIYFKSKEVQFGVRVTLQQTAGSYRNIEYDFFKEA
jgi:hypothetical protein